MAKGVRLPPPVGPAVAGFASIRTQIDKHTRDGQSPVWPCPASGAA
jgi:hypothetical protein